MNFEIVIRLEVHVESEANSRIFSSASAHFGAEPNNNTNVIDQNYPGVSPVMSRGTLEFGMKAAPALSYEISKETHLDRKNYFYPNNLKAHQISQFDQPIGHDDWIKIEVRNRKKKIHIERVHPKEDVGKSIYSINEYSYVDLDRQGTSLIEIVSEADMHSSEETYAHLKILCSIIQLTEVFDMKMEEGSMRRDANISLRPYGQEEFGIKVKLKNLNSMGFVRKNLTHEGKRQVKVLLSGGEIQQETRRFDEATSTTLLMRVEEGPSDYRYFLEPDVPRFSVDDEWVEKVRANLPEMPTPCYARYINELGLLGYDAVVLTLTKETSDFFEATLADGVDAKQASNWLASEVSAYSNSERIELVDTELIPENLTDMIVLINDGAINSKIARKVFRELIENGGDTKKVVETKGLVQLSGPAQLLPVINEILDNNQQSIDDSKNGKDYAIGFLVGQIMKAVRGQTDPGVVNKLL